MLTQLESAPFLCSSIQLEIEAEKVGILDVDGKEGVREAAVHVREG